MTEYPGRRERGLARELIREVAHAAAGVMHWRNVDLRSAAEHLVYTALRSGGGGVARGSAAGGPLRVVRAVSRSRFLPKSGTTEQPRVVVLVTQPIHVALYRPIAERLAERGVESTIVDAETRGGRAVNSDDIVARLVHYLRPGDVPALLAHAALLARQLSDTPVTWRPLLSDEDAGPILTVLQRGISLAAIDAARLARMLNRLAPDLLVCFSESGLLGRLAPAVASAGAGRIPVVDLPHAEAADPWGTDGVGYDALAVYGPRAAEVMRLAGIDQGRIIEIGPLRYDGILAASRETAAVTEPRRILFASQPVDPRKPALHPDIKRAALSAAVAAGAVAAPAEVVAVPHPVEPPGGLELLVGELSPPAGVRCTVASAGLHGLLPGSWLLVTASSQSVFEAVIAGIPAVTVHPAGSEPPVTFAADGIALGVTTDEEAEQVARSLLNSTTRDRAVRASRAALGNRIGPLDGRAADRAASWLGGLATESRRRPRSPAR
jgi:hypothetical protein